MLEGFGAFLIDANVVKSGAVSAKSCSTGPSGLRPVQAAIYYINSGIESFFHLTFWNIGMGIQRWMWDMRLWF
jgi:hypothetical protein